MIEQSYGKTDSLGGHQFGGHQFGGHQFGGLMFGGWTGDLPDARDVPLYPPVGRPLTGADLRPVPGLEPVEPPPDASIDWRVPVLEQQPLQTCVSCAVASVVRHLDASGRGVTGPAPSPLFLYYNARVLERTGRCDTGCGLRSALKALRRHGICTDDVWGPPRQFVERPTPEAYENAFYAGTVSYRRIYRLGTEPDRLDLVPVRRALAQGLPVLFGFALYDSFRAAGDGAPVPLPSANERVLFGHAAVLTGYDGDDFTAVNSWGESWGGQNRGRFTMPAAYLGDRRLAKDFWTITSLDGISLAGTSLDGSGVAAGGAGEHVATTA